MNFLTKENFKSSLIQNFFPKNISEKVFSTQWINYNFDTIKLLNLRLKSINTPCSNFSIYKGETERRILGIPHISTYLILIDCILNKINLIYEKIEKNSSSTSKNIFLPYDIIYSFEDSLKKRIWDSIGNKYILSLDISRCYENIYTHSITWAILGKENAKEEFLKHKDKRSDLYKMADELDIKIRKINNGETKGIPTGPITSRLISELILAEIDSILKEKYPNLKYNRYVDDYKFYFVKKEEAIQFIPKFQKILYDFKFSLNESKTKIDLYPCGIFTEDLRAELGNYDFKKNTVVSFIKKIMHMHNQGVKGAFKYGIKVLSSQAIEEKDRKYVLAVLLNALMVFPMNSEVIITIFEKNELLSEKNKEQVTDIINRLLSENIANDYDEEIFWNLYFLMKFNLKIDIENILKILDKQENFTTIMILDYIFKNNYNRSNEEIKEKIVILKEKLKKQKIYSEEWLLIYECEKNNWIRGLRNIIKSDIFLTKILEENKGFYISPLK